jgi:hypothetical protein
MFLNAFAVAEAEYLRAQAKEHLQHSFREQGLTVLPHYSPGYDGWTLTDQQTLYDIALGAYDEPDRPLRVLPSGGLWPSKSLIAAYGITTRTDIAKDLKDFWSRLTATSHESAASNYVFSNKALSLWREKRLHLKVLSHQQLVARFRFDGTTCNNMGVPIAIDYHVSLERNSGPGYRIVNCFCQPAEGDVGFRSMCAYLENPDQHQSQVESYQPLIGRPLDEALAWHPPVSPAGCLCSRASQDHKWRIVLQTIHYALVNHD